MINITKFWFFKKYGLLVSDTDVVMVSWHKGVLERIAVFSNDEDGLIRFNDYLSNHEQMYAGKAFYILTNIIGEDYRVEKVAHLVGKYKTDFHSRRMSQLFRGSTLCMSSVQGREERGRREDIVLFYGLLTENKVVPWMNAITRSPTRYLAGVHSASFVASEVLRKIKSNWSSKNSLLMTIHEKGLLRQSFFASGLPRFSRVSKIDDSSADAVSAALRKELERTIQYLNSLKISTAGGIDVELICPGNMVGQLRELVASGEKLRFNFHDAASVANSIQLSNSLDELGRDSSLLLHSMFCYPRLKQLAPFSRVRLHRMKSFGSMAMIAVVAWALVSSFDSVGYVLQGYQLSGENAALASNRDSKQRSYDEEARLSEEPPSDPANIAAVSQTFRVLSRLDIFPSQLFNYFAEGFSENRRTALDGLRWYITDDVNGNEPIQEALFNGNDIFQVLEVSGRFLAVPGETYLDVADRADFLIESFKRGRSDIAVIPVELPSRDLDESLFSGEIDENFSIEEARQRDFKVKIIWKEYTSEKIEQMARDI